MSGLLQVISSTDRRGAETFAVDLSAALARRGRLTEVVALAPGRSGGLAVRPLAASRFAGLAGLRRRARASSVVLAHGSSTLPATAVALLGTGVPFVYQSIGSPLYWASTPARRARVRLFLGRAARVVALWPQAARDLVDHLGVDRDRIHVIPNGRPARCFHPVNADQRLTERLRYGVPASAHVALYLGALSPEKGVDGLIRALATAPDVHLVVAGDGPDRSSLEAQAAGLLGDRSMFLGGTDDPASVLAVADVVVLPSRTEGLPAVAIEAGLCGLPVVATDVGGTGQIVEDGETGVLVPAGDDDALAAAIRRVLQSPSSYGDRGRHRCLRDFELEVIAGRWARLLDEVSGGRW